MLCNGCLASAEHAASQGIAAYLVPHNCRCIFIAVP